MQLEGLVNWEQRGIPKAAGTSSSSQFDLGRMHRLLDRLGKPHQAWPAVHVAGSKGEFTSQNESHVIRTTLQSW